MEIRNIGSRSLLYIFGADIKTKMFGFGEKKFVGIDVGTATVKIVELKIKDNKPLLTNYAWMRIDNLAGGADGKDSYFENALPVQLKRMIQESKLSGRDAYLSIPAFGGLITLIEFPELAKEDLDQAIRFEAHKYIPVPLDDIVLSWDVVNKKVATVRAVVGANFGNRFHLHVGVEVDALDFSRDCREISSHKCLTVIHMTETSGHVLIIRTRKFL